MARLPVFLALLPTTARAAPRRFRDVAKVFTDARDEERCLLDDVGILRGDEPPAAARGRA